MLTRLLTLTPEQQTGVKAVLDQQAAQLNALRSKQEEGETPEARQANRAQAKELREQSNTKISALLNDSQKKTFADWIQRRKADMERRRGQEGPPPPDGGGPPPNE
jgi:DNA repair ATPase RecN